MRADTPSKVPLQNGHERLLNSCTLKHARQATPRQCGHAVNRFASPSLRRARADFFIRLDSSSSFSSGEHPHSEQTCSAAFSCRSFSCSFFLIASASLISSAAWRSALHFWSLPKKSSSTSTSVGSSRLYSFTSLIVISSPRMMSLSVETASLSR